MSYLLHMSFLMLNFLQPINFLQHIYVSMNHFASILIKQLL